MAGGSGEIDAAVPEADDEYEALLQIAVEPFDLAFGPAAIRATHLRREAVGLVGEEAIEALVDKKLQASRPPERNAG